jgi:hypothetical protein
MHKLPIRIANGHWEVQTPLDHHSEWIRCDSQQDAQAMAVSGNLAYEVFEGKRSGEVIAQALLDAVRLFLKYGCTAQAAWLHEHAKYAKGEPSIFDGATPTDH